MSKYTLAILRISRSHQDTQSQSRLLREEIRKRGLLELPLAAFQANRDKYKGLEGSLCIWIEETMTGKTVRRKGFQWALGEVKAKRVAAILCYKADRIIRSPVAAWEMAEACKNTKTEFFSLTEKIDMTSPSGEFMFSIMAGMAKFEIDNLRERSMDGKAAAKEKALKEGRRWVEGGSPPGWFAERLIKLKPRFQELVGLKFTNYHIMRVLGLNYVTVRKMRRMLNEPWLTREQARERAVKMAR